MASPKVAVVVRGGWPGHQPEAATDLFIPFLAANGFRVRVESGPAIFADQQFMSTVDLIVHCVSMSTIEIAELAGLRAAVQSGSGLAGWHGGMTGAYLDSPGYLQLVGATFAAHPANGAPDQLTGHDSDNFVRHTIRFDPAAAAHPIIAGLQDFELVTEQYWLLHDDLNDVLATTTQQARAWDPWHRPVTSPAVWTRQWGAGRIFVCTPGHNVGTLQDPTVTTLIQRGLMWASR